MSRLIPIVFPYPKTQYFLNILIWIYKETQQKGPQNTYQNRSKMRPWTHPKLSLGAKTPKPLHFSIPGSHFGAKVMPQGDPQIT